LHVALKITAKAVEITRSQVVSARMNQFGKRAAMDTGGCSHFRQFNAAAFVKGFLRNKFRQPNPYHMCSFFGNQLILAAKCGVYAT